MFKHTLTLLAASLVVVACSDASTAPTVGAAALASVSGSGAGGTSSRVIVEIALTAESGPTHGKARFQTRDNDQRELEIEIEDAKPGTSVAFFLGGAQVGATQTVDAFGSARVELNTRLGDKVPASVSGLTVEARSGDSIIASGSFK